MNEQDAMADQPEPTLTERLAQPLRINFSKLAEAIRANEQGKTIPEGVRELLDVAARSLHAEVSPDVDERQSALVLLAASAITAMLAEDADGGWTALSIVNVLASVGQRLWHTEPRCPHPTMGLIVTREATTCGACGNPVNWDDEPKAAADA